MRDTAHVTVVVATRNRAPSLSRTLRHLVALPERPPIVVVDNGSTDGTAELVTDRYPDVRLIRLPRNRGAVARNLGVAAAGTAYVAFADDDSWWEPGALREATALFAAHPRLALVAARIDVGPDRRPDAINAVMAAAPLGQPSDLPGPSVAGFLACGAVVRRRAFLGAGGFDPVVFFMGEEERLAYDIRAAGWGLSYCKSVIAHHSPGADAHPGRKARLAARNLALTAWMRRPLSVAWARSRCVPAAMRAELAKRLPAALAARRAPHPVVEAELRQLARATG